MQADGTKPILRLPAFSSPRMVVLVLGIVLCAAVGAATIFYRLGIAQERLGGQEHELALWAALQLDRETSRMNDAVRVWRNGDAPFETVSVRLDILVSRLDYYRDGDFSRSSTFRDREVALVAGIAPLVQELDQLVGGLAHRGDREAAALEVRNVLRRIERLSGQLLNVVSQSSAESRAAHRVESAQLYNALGLAAAALVAAVALALGAVLAQNRALTLARRRAEMIGGELRRSAVAAQAAARAKAVFLATMSHEIRTPMNGVLGAASLLGASPLRPEQRRRVDMIAACGRALLALIDDILDFSKLEGGRTDFAIAAFTPDELLQAVADICAPGIRERGLDFIATGMPGMPATIRSDVQRLRQVLVNLVSNAVKFTDTGAVTLRLAMETGEDGRHWLFAGVADTGPGIGAEVMAGLFREFEQGDPAVGRRYGGTGLGLAICKRIVESLGGRIGVESELGRGSLFWFRVPAAIDQPCVPVGHRGFACVQAPLRVVGEAMEALLCACGYVIADTPGDGCVVLLHAAQVEHAMPDSVSVVRFGPGTDLSPPITAASLRVVLDEGVAAPPARPQLPPRGMRPMRLLVAEDNAMNRDVMEQVLRTIGHDVVMAADGAEAVAILEQEKPFDAVLLDLQMPVMDGLAAARAIRALPGPARHTRLLAVTANAMPSDRIACLAAGMDGFLAKPVTIARLTTALLALATDTTVDEPPPPRDASPSIDPDHRNSLLAALRPGSIERLAASFWEEIGDDLAALRLTDVDAVARDDRMHRIAGSAATLGYTRVAAVARAARGAPPADPGALCDALREALTADAALLSADLLNAARATLV